MKTERGLELLERVRAVCAPLPETTESIDGFGHTVFKVRGKTYVMMGDGSDREDAVSLSFKSDKEQQRLLLQQEGKYVKTPYIGQHGWVSIDPKGEPDWDELPDLLREAYLKAAPKTAAKQALEMFGKQR